MPAMAGMADDSAAMAMVGEIVVTGSRLRPRFNAPVGGSTLSGDALATAVRATLGDTLASLPGVSSTSFGPSAARPVLRGFTGERTRLLVDDIASLDVSGSSPDHAVAINPLASERIEILRGPGALAFASGAVGGVVNSFSQRVPRKRPDAVHGLASARFGTAADETSLGARIDAPLGQRLAVHFDGQFVRYGNVDIGGPVLAPAVRTMALASPVPATRGLAALRGVLPNTAGRTYEVATGLTWFGDDVDIGAGVSFVDSRYGLPTRFSLDPAVGNPDSRIELQQARVDLRGGWRPGGDVIDEVRLRFGFADYAHNERLTTGLRTARFRNQGWEARAELGTQKLGVVRLSGGVQVTGRDFEVRGDAPLLPPTTTRGYAVFSHAEIDLAPLRVEAAGRFERFDVAAQRDPILANPATQRGYNAGSLSLGANYRFDERLSLGLNAQYGERAPVVEELFTQGTDPGTQGVLLGNAALGLERSWGIEGVVRGFAGPVTVEASGYYYEFPNYIFAGETGEVRAGLPVFQFQAQRAQYHGFEVQLRADIARVAGWKLGGSALVDYTAATLADGSPVPRIPPLRLLAGLTAGSARADARFEVEWVTRQDAVGAFETPTPSYVSVNFNLTARPFGEALALTLSANNLTDSDARRAASFLKDYAPIAGRDIRVGARYRF
ncbi:hypothetical protein IP88_09815 [alpha proteobacterium AAP81b]|nr:hypothetical protein IP88_09815 [alpha proteobacterium AAP81b]